MSATFPKIAPSAKQLEFMDWEFGGFFHFGIRSFYMGHRDWDNREMSPAAFAPTELDIESWVKVYAEAGAKYLILTAKHHDGFANWPSKYTEFSVKNSPWKDGKGDVVAEYVAACRKYGMKVGLYYSPAQWGGAVDFSDEKSYDDYFINQIGELLTGYGRIDYLWFDGNGSQGHNYDWDRIIPAIRRMQPGILLFGGPDRDVRWIGNEEGWAPLPNFDTRPLGDGFRFLPGECDFKMRTRTWFHCEEDEADVKTVDTLMSLWDQSVGRGANYLINIGPDERGLLPEKDAETLRRFGEALRRRFAHPLPLIRPMDMTGVSGSELVFDAGGQTFSTVVLQEDLTEGEGVLSFDLLADGKVVFSRENLGHKAICTFDPVTADRLTLRVNDASGRFAIRSCEIFA